MNTLRGFWTHRPNRAAMMGERHGLIMIQMESAP
jgi:hypothetical protein